MIVKFFEIESKIKFLVAVKNCNERTEKKRRGTDDFEFKKLG